MEKSGIEETIEENSSQRNSNIESNNQTIDFKYSYLIHIKKRF
jgi:hypothetical protein